MPNINTLFFDGKSTMAIDQFINLVGGAGVDGNKKSLIRLYSAVSWLYRGVELLENGVSSMPFEIRKGEKTIYQFDPNSGTQDQPPKNLEILVDIPRLSGMVEGASVLRGQAYVFNLKNGRKTLELRWFLPDSMTPKYDPIGRVSGFTRLINGKEQSIDIEDTVYFWPHDKFVENGPAKNFPGKAALASAGVLASMDDFLGGYFDRGLVRAGFLKYEQQINDEGEKARIKEWWNRLTSGVRNAFENLIVRGDFSYEEIGQGLKELENTDLTVTQREAIATALGIPQSKMTQPPGGLGDTKTPDDLTFINDTIIPACNWIQRAWNRQYFMPQGLMMVYTPQKLSIMQQDEERRSIAFRNYVGTGVAPGYTVDEAEAILGIHVPEEIKEKTRQDARQQLAQATAPEKSIDFLKALDKRDERNQFLRWLKNRDYTAVRVEDFHTEYLTAEEKTAVAYSAIRKSQKGLRIDKLFDEYGDSLARFIQGNLKKSQQDFQKGFEETVFNGLLKIFIEATGVDDTLTPTEQAQFDKLFIVQKNAIPGYVSDIYASKGLFEAARDNLQALGGNLGGRLQMWKNAARLFWNRGLISGRREEKMTWRIGGTEESCNDCLFYNGQSKTKDEWSTLAGVLIYPQSRALECNGYNCDCTLVLE